MINGLLKFYAQRPRHFFHTGIGPPTLNASARDAFSEFRSDPLFLGFPRLCHYVISISPCGEQRHCFFGLPGETAIKFDLSVKFSGPSLSSSRRSKYGELPQLSPPAVVEMRCDLSTSSSLLLDSCQETRSHRRRAGLRLLARVRCLNTSCTTSKLPVLRYSKACATVE